MGIIVSSFPGCGKQYLMNTYGDKVKIFNANVDFIEEPEHDEKIHPYDYNKFVDKVMNVIDEYDIVFIPSGKLFLEAFENRKIDYDLFYPSKERRGEFIENFVRKRLPYHDIMMMDRDFDKHIDRFDDIESENCYKHKLSEKGHFIGNDTAIMQYINDIQKKHKNNEQKEGVEETSRSEKDNEKREG